MNDNGQIGIQCSNCNASIPPSESKCPFCDAKLDHKMGSTETDDGEPEITDRVLPDIDPPDNRKIPHVIFYWDIGIVLFASLAVFLLISQTEFFQADRVSIAEKWIDEFYKDFSDSKNSNWRVESLHTASLDQTNLICIRDRNPIINLDFLLQKKREEFGFKQFFRYYTEEFDSARFADIQKRYPKDQLWLLISQNNTLFSLNFHFSFYAPEDKYPSFDKSNSKNVFQLYPKGIISVAGIIIFSVLFHVFILIYMRKLHFQAYIIYQQKRTNAIYKAKTLYNGAKAQYQAGETAKALVSLEMAIEINPRYDEARELRKKILSAKDTDIHGINNKPAQDTNIEVNLDESPSSTVLYLKILGTPYAYQLPENLDIISIGRQQRKKGRSEDTGNDLVIRVSGSEDKNLRISRRHLEIHRIDKQYFLMDKSNGNTILNGVQLIQDIFHRIRSGDRIIIGNVLTLEVMIRSNLFAKNAGNIIQVKPAESGDELVIEKSIGELITRR